MQLLRNIAAGLLALLAPAPISQPVFYQCCKCKEKKPLDREHFFRCNSSATGFQTRCKGCDQAYKKVAPVIPTRKELGEKLGFHPSGFTYLMNGRFRTYKGYALSDASDPTALVCGRGKKTVYLKKVTPARPTWRYETEEERLAAKKKSAAKTRSSSSPASQRTQPASPTAPL